MRKCTIIVGAVALAFSVGLAAAQAASTTKARSAASIECSKQADAKGLHGKARRHFRHKCRTSYKQSSGGTIGRRSYQPKDTLNPAGPK
ncbi:MAG: hypothetical protein GEU95_09795 [Rhizobiales bacterium]|nr:hypothetical protein [Hyphomicrobiales bacterium]